MAASILILAATGAALAQPALEPFAPLVGHCFAGPAPVAGAIDKHCFESVYGGQHVRDRHVVTVAGKDVYSGETLYSATGTKVMFTYWNSLGGRGTGEADLRTDLWKFSGTIHGTATGAEQPMAASWTIVPDGYEVREGKEPARLFKRSE
jgi:hypothetical protein